MTNEFDMYCEKFRDWLAAGAITTAAMSPLYKKAGEFSDYSNEYKNKPKIEYNIDDTKEDNVPSAIPVGEPSADTDAIDTIKYKLNRLKENKQLLKNFISRLPEDVLRQLTGLNDQVPDEFLAPILYGGIYKNFPRYDIIAAVISRETIFGKILNKAGKGDSNHGHGIMQIDDRSHGKWLKLGLWKDPYENVAYGLGEINGNMRIFGGDLFKSLAAYNCGAGNVKKALKNKRSAEAYTAHHNYASDVLGRAKKLKKQETNLAQN